MPHYNTVNPFVVVKGGASAFIEFVAKVFDGKENEAVRTPDKDGSLIHAEVQIGDAMLLIADSKADWPFTPALLQVYVDDANETIKKAVDRGASIITELSPFYNGYNLARIKDSWGNIWWLYEKTKEQPVEHTSNTDWHKDKPSYIYQTLMDAMKNLREETTS